MIILRELAPAKLNLYLQITGKRPDGYHTLESLVVFADVHDKVEVTPAEEITLHVEGAFANKLDAAEDNIVMKAARSLAKQFGVAQGAALTLHKNLPIGAGLGGGSGDAAATLKLLSRFWKIKPTSKELHAIAVKLGADIPACLRGESLYMSGIGESVEAGPPVLGMHSVIVWPGKPLFTRDVYAHYTASAFSAAGRRPHAFATQEAMIQFVAKYTNDLEKTAMDLLPEINSVIKALKATQGCALARMSGSGSACFGLFKQPEDAGKAAQQLAAANPAWWVNAAMLR